MPVGHPLLDLHRAIGNHAVGQLLRAKLEVGSVDDPLEQEADQVAEKVLRMPDPTAAAGAPEEPPGLPVTVQRRAAPGASAGAAEAPPVVEQALSGGGRPLDAETRRYFEPRFGFDLSKVRIHTDARAEASARAVNARAYTVGRDIVFGQGRYASGEREGKRLLAHELAHVAQQAAPGSRMVVARDTGGAPSGSPAAGTGGEQAAQILDRALQRSDETAVLTVLEGRTLAELEIIKNAYQKRTTRALVDDLQQKLSEDALSRARDLLRAPSPAMDLARQLSDAIKRIITDTDAITGALSGRTYDQWAEIQQAYREMNSQRELVADLRAAVSSSEWSEIQKLLPAAPTPGAGPAGSAGARAGVQARAAAVKQQIDDALGVYTDKEQLFAAFTGRTKDELIEIARLYGGLEAFRDKLKSELSNDDLARANEILGNTATAMAMRIHAELDSFRPSKDAVLAIAGGRAPSELTQMYEEYARLYRTPLDTDLAAEFANDPPIFQPLSRLEDPAFRARWEKAIEQALKDLRETAERAPEGKEPCHFGAPSPDPANWMPAAPAGSRAGHEPRAATRPLDRETSLEAKSTEVRSSNARADAAKPPLVVDETAGAWTPENDDPYTAISKLATRLGEWSCDCAMYVEIAWLMAWHSLLPADEFNKRFDGLKVRRIGTTGLAQEHYVHDEPGFKARWEAAPVGAKVSWSNTSKIARPPWADEHAIKRVKTPNPKDDIYEGHGLEKAGDEAYVMHAMAEFADDFPSVVCEFEDMRLMGFMDQVVDDLLQQKRADDEVRRPAVKLSGLDPAVANAIAKPRTPDEIRAWVKQLKEELPRAAKIVVERTKSGIGSPVQYKPPQIWGVEYFLGQLRDPSVSPLFADALQGTVEASIVQRGIETWLMRPGTEEEQARYVEKYIRRNDLSLAL